MEEEINGAAAGFAKSQPKSRLISIVSILRKVAELSEGELTVAEVADALTLGSSECYNGDTMGLYPPCVGLAEPILGMIGDEIEVHNTRVNIICEMYNSEFWNDPSATIMARPYGRIDVEDIFVLKDDGVEIARRLWKFFYPSREMTIDASVITEGIGTKRSEEKLGYTTPHLVILNAAIAEFFEQRKERDAKKEEVVDWIKNKMTASGMADSDNIAQAMFTIIKPSNHDPRKRRG